MQRMVAAVIDIHVLGLEHHFIGDSETRYAVLLLTRAHARHKIGARRSGLRRWGLYAHSAVILLARALPTIRAATLNKSTQIINRAAVPQTIVWASGLPSP